MSNDGFEEPSDLELLRQKNLEERNAFLKSLMNDSFLVEGLSLFGKPKKQASSSTRNKRKRGDSSFRFTGVVPSERRSSARLQNKKPDFVYEDLPDESQITHDSNSLKDLEDVVFQVKKPRKWYSRSLSSRIIPAEEVTEEMIRDIQVGGNKVYGTAGTSCHQCRQKTVDTKTICRSGSCVGTRGQFCGICVINRYGEDPVQALKDPNWKCYVCRGCCNCSLCRLKQGKRPTGILAPLAKTNGYKSVQDFLTGLKGYGDYDTGGDPENLLGFEGNVAVMGAEKRTEIKNDYEVEEFKNFVHSIIKS
ncbi:cell division cycle-associated protein 7-like [Tribolium madens]|uniref:cell division cycle-associated protein 7-like n=1 Tax=Tribolium madens TaxID=41895 RepID=UPI001CF739D5|nr:cell division cycle-associated protein 7-like [Tribolium madens]XP_044256985.1 cell division cycle-associated protein 7-like [Tribolium madens]